MSQIKLIVINFIVLIILILSLEAMSGVVRLAFGRDFLFPANNKVDPCREMKTDTLLSHVPNHLGLCAIKGGYADGKYVRYDISNSDKPILLTLGGSTTTGFYQHFSDGNTYPSHLAKLLVDDYQVMNVGVGGYSSLQELYKMTRDAHRINNLHTVISLSGINDLPNYQGRDEERRVNFPFLTDIQNQMNSRQTWIDQRQGWNLQGLLPNLTSLLTKVSLRGNHQKIKTTNLNDSIEIDAEERWHMNVVRTHAILHAQGVRYFVFLQPTLGLKGVQSLPMKDSHDEEIFKDMSDININKINILYDRLKTYCSKLSYCFDISNEVSPTGDVYSDRRHHNANGNKLLARVIAKKLYAIDEN